MNGRKDFDKRWGEGEGRLELDIGGTYPFGDVRGSSDREERPTRVSKTSTSEILVLAELAASNTRSSGGECACDLRLCLSLAVLPSPTVRLILRLILTQGSACFTFFVFPSWNFTGGTSAFGSTTGPPVTTSTLARPSSGGKATTGRLGLDGTDELRCISGAT